MTDPPVFDIPATPPLAGFLRRAAATLTDVIVSLLGAFLVLSVIGLFIPMDSPRMALFTRPVMFVGFLYVGIGPFVFANSLGKYAFAVRVVSDKTGKKPALWQFLVRWVLLLVWPLEALILLFAPSRKRIGDRLAATSVFEDSAAKPRWGKRIGLSLAALFVLYLVLVEAMQAAARNTEMFAAASAYLQERQIGKDKLGEPVALSDTPLKIVMKKDRGEIIVAADGARAKGYIEMKLFRDAGKWRVTRWQVTDGPSGRGYSYRY